MIFSEIVRRTIRMVQWTAHTSRSYTVPAASVAIKDRSSTTAGLRLSSWSNPMNLAARGGISFTAELCMGTELVLRVSLIPSGAPKRATRS